MTVSFTPDSPAVLDTLTDFFLHLLQKADYLYQRSSETLLTTGLLTQNGRKVTQPIPDTCFLSKNKLL
jgi:hypothetical protein